MHRFPPLPDTQLFSELQWKTLLSLADTMIPSVRSSGNANSTKVVPAPQFDSAVSKLASDIPGPDSAQKATRYLEENASSNPAFRDNIQRLFGTFVHQEGRKGLSLVLNALKYSFTHVSPVALLTGASISQHKGRLVRHYRLNYPHSGPTPRDARACLCQLGFVAPTASSFHLPCSLGHLQKIMGNVQSHYPPGDRFSTCPDTR